MTKPGLLTEHGKQDMEKQRQNSIVYFSLAELEKSVFTKFTLLATTDFGKFT